MVQRTSTARRTVAGPVAPARPGPPSPVGKPLRLAAVDVGSNTIRAIVVEADGEGSFRVLDDEKASVRLGEGLSRTGLLSEAAMARALDAVGRMAKIAEGLGARSVDAVATSAVRRAANGAAFLQSVERRTGLRVRAISGEEEAELAVLSARHSFNLGGARYAVVDVGGGSVEVAAAAGDHLRQVWSLDIGTVVLTETFLEGDPVPKDDFRRLRRRVKRSVREAVEVDGFAPRCVVGSGGTVTAIGAMVTAIKGERYDTLHGYEVLRSDLVHLQAMLLRKTRKERRALPGLGPDRADIILAGVAVVDRLMKHLGANVLLVNERGIREGLVLRRLLRRVVPGQSAPRDRISAAAAFARSCSSDMEHSRHVADLTLSVFDALAGRLGLGAEERSLLETAAILHDVGYFISYARHHKHSYHLIRHAGLFDLTPRDREVVAAVARYHRGALPARRHRAFRQLGESDRALVRTLGGILRLADGLDRRRNGQVRAVSCAVEGRSLVVRLRGQGDLSVEAFGGESKSDLLEEALGMRVHVRTGPRGGDAPPAGE